MLHLQKISITMGVLVMLTIGGLYSGCRHSAESRHLRDLTAQHRSIYYWKTVFQTDSAELAFIKRHDIGCIYLRMFDVAPEKNYETGGYDIVPAATTRFKSPIPEGIEIIPTTYIKLEALREMKGMESEMASLIVDRLLAMASYNHCGKIEEVQLDCDWTATTKEIYSNLCRSVRDTLHKKNIDLSITVRLHQLRESAPPADRGVLMLYNTGTLKDFKTENSILDIADVKPYLRHHRYPIPLDYAFPAYGWGIKFRNGEFVQIVSENDTVTSPNEYIRKERPSAADIIAVKHLVEKKLGKPSRGNILYHLDNSQLKSYSDDEINEILTD